MLDKIKGLIVAFMEENNLNTYNVRLMAKNKEPNPLGASINTINKIIKKDSWPKSRTTLKSILDAIGANYEVDSIGNIKMTEDGQEEK